MAKRIIFSTPEEVMRGSNTLKDCHVEHVLVEYPAKDDKPTKKFIVVMNKDLAEAKASLELAHISIRKVHGARHFEMIAKNYKHYKYEKK